MKKLLFSLTLLSMVAISCGPSAEEKDAAQQENETMVNEQVDEIIQDLETPAEEAPADSAVAEPAAAE